MSRQVIGNKEPKELVVSSSRHEKEPWEMQLCYQMLEKRDVFFWFQLSPNEARALAAELLLVADEVETANAKLPQGGAA